MPKKQWFLNTRRLNILSLFILVSVIMIAIYIMHNSLGLIPGLDFGPGQYYYTDLPDWQERFFGKSSITIGTNHPVLFFTTFFIWGFICFKFLKWVDNKF
ncbi:MAG: hypothetical protein ACOWWO_10865 [Peptococcaceae bacterium]